MRLKELWLGLLTPVAAFTPAPTEQTDRLAAIASYNVLQLQSSPGQYHKYEPRHYGRPLPPLKPPSYGERKCTPQTVQVRREWDSFSCDEKEAYIFAVKCLMSKPSQSNYFAPGSRNRWDDFSAVHINQTGSIHGTGSFLHWHRYFTWLYERALRTECNYHGYQPYLNWPRYALDLHNAPVFDGSPSSIGGNGAYDPTNNGTNVPSNAAPNIVLPPEGGGGCITTGPFANTTIRLGPVTPALANVPPNPLQNGLGYNPRCIRRDISSTAAKKYLNDEHVAHVLLSSKNISAFQTTLQGNFPAGYLGIHTAGHFSVGGDPGGDLFASTSDPYFFLHHAAIDRAWWIWQNLAPGGKRYNEIGGTLTVNNSPPSRNATLEDLLEMGPLGETISIREGVNTLSGPYCYVYE